MKVPDLSERAGSAATQARSEVKRDVILKAANALLEERGIAAMTMEEVAARAGVAKTTVYRRWASKGALAIEGFLAEMSTLMRYDESESPVADIKAQLARVAQTFRSRKGPLVAGIIAEAQRDPETMKAFLEGYVVQRRQTTAGVIRRGIEAGEFPPDTDIDMAIDQLYGPIYYRLLMGLPLPAPRDMGAFVDRVVAGLNAKVLSSPKGKSAPPRRAASVRR